MTTASLSPLTGEPLVSVMIVNYNYERFLPEAIESVLSQTYQNFEIIVCDDGSTDKSREVIARFAQQDPRIKSIFKQNAGVAAALNDAYQATTGEVIAMLDADDLFEPRKLELVVEKFRPGGRLGMVVNTLTKVNSHGETIGRIPEFGELDRGDLREKLLHSAAHWSVAPTSGIAFRRACAERVYPIPETQFRTEADAYMCTVAPLYYAVDVIDTPMTIYRVHSSNVTASTSMDVKFCERIMSAGERVFSILSSAAEKEGWKVNSLIDNPTYCEMSIIRLYLLRKSFGARAKAILDLLRAASRVRTADRLKTATKALILSSAVLLPQALGKRVIDAVYLPNPLKRMLSQLLRRRKNNEQR